MAKEKTTPTINSADTDIDRDRELFVIRNTESGDVVTAFSSKDNADNRCRYFNSIAGGMDVFHVEPVIVKFKGKK